MAADGPPFSLDPETSGILDRLWDSGHAAYVVGGGVRDALLGLPHQDWDIATDALPARITQLFPGSTYKNRFGTVDAHGVEVTTFRRDHRYADHRRPDSVTFSEDIHEDLARRDFTINSIAWGRHGAEGVPRIVDPADGRGDLRARLVRAVGDPNRRFDEDALRLLRAIRIAARLDFAIEPVTLEAVVAHAADVEWVSAERIGSEIRRMVAGDTPSDAVELLRDTQLLAGTVPELDTLAHDDPTAFARTLVALDVAAAAGDSEDVRLAVLLSDIGPDAARQTLERLRVSSRDAAKVAALVRAGAQSYDPAWSDPDVRRFMGSVSASQLDQVLALRDARASGRSDAEAGEAELRARVTVQRTSAAPLRLADLAVDGGDLRETLGLPQGPTIGLVLDRLMADVIEDPSLNASTTLLARAEQLLEELDQHGRATADERSFG